MSDATPPATTAAFSLAPWLSVEDGARASAFYQDAFGAEETFRMEDPTGAVIAGLSRGGVDFWISGSSPGDDGVFAPEAAGPGRIRLILTVPDPDAVFAQALAAGAREVHPVKEDWGWRVGRVVDPFGFHWEIGRPLEGTK